MFSHSQWEVESVSDRPLSSFPGLADRLLLLPSPVMGRRVLFLISLMLMLSFLLSDAKEEGDPLVVFLDGPTSRYLRSNRIEEMTSMSMDEIAASIAVLLGFEPPLSFPSGSSQKLDEILLPNPFDRPRAVFLMEVSGIDDSIFANGLSGSIPANAFASKILRVSKDVIELPGAYEVSVIPVDNYIEDKCGCNCIDKELSFLAHWFGGLYSGSMEMLDGKLSVPLVGGTVLDLQISEISVRKFVLGLVSLIRGVGKAIETHEDFSGRSLNPSELIMGQFTSFKGLQDDVHEDILVHCRQLLQTTIEKLFETLQTSYGGKIVGVILYTGQTNMNEGRMLDVGFSPHTSRFLQEQTLFNGTSADILLVRRSLAWITGIILLVSTLIGICLLTNMPLTRDTLLYSNVKLD